MIRILDRLDAVFDRGNGARSRERPRIPGACGEVRLAGEFSALGSRPSPSSGPGMEGAGGTAIAYFLVVGWNNP
jgi:hypothetical protein